MTVAVRAGLRAVALISTPYDQSYFPLDKALLVFRGMALAWAVARHPSLGKELAVVGARTSVIPFAPSRAAQAAAYVAYSAGGTTDRFAGAGGVHELAIKAIEDTIEEVADSEPFLNAADADVEYLEQASRGARVAGAAVLAGMPLWLSTTPNSFYEGWADLRERLLRANEGWEVWVGWYEDRLVGRPSFGEQFDVAVASLPNTLWDQGPGAVNARIKELIAEHTPSKPIPTQGPGPNVMLNDDLKIALAPPAAIDDGTNLARIGELLPVAQQALADLTGQLNPNTHPELLRIVADYGAAIAPDPEIIRWGLVYGLGVRLENASVATSREIPDRLHEPLEDAAQEALYSLLALHGPLILATREGRELSEAADEFRMTRDEQAALRDAAQTVAAALRNSKLADASVVNITEAAAEAIGEGRHPERGSIFWLATIKNIATLLVPAAVLGAAHSGVDYLAGGGVAGLAAGAAAAGFGGFGLAESNHIRMAARALGTDISRLVETVRDQASLVRAQAIERLRLLTPFRDFVAHNEKPLREIAESSAQLRWALRYIDFIVRPSNQP